MNMPVIEREPALDKERISLCEALDNVLNKGAVVIAEITLSVADIDLIYIELRALITSVETARRLHITSDISKTHFST